MHLTNSQIDLLARYYLHRSYNRKNISLTFLGESYRIRNESGMIGEHVTTKGEEGTGVLVAYRTAEADGRLRAVISHVERDGAPVDVVRHRLNTVRTVHLLEMRARRQLAEAYRVAHRT